MIKIYRYSNDEFRPQTQTVMMKRVDVNVESIIDSDIEKCIQKLKQENAHHLDPEFEFKGIFIFLSTPNDDDRSFYLDHVESPLHTIKFNEGILDGEAVCYVDDGIVYKNQNKMKVKEAFEKNYKAVYLPESQIKYIEKI